MVYRNPVERESSGVVVPDRSDPWGVLPNRGRDLTLAAEAVTYLRTQGLDHRAVAECLRTEFEIDLTTAEALATEPQRIDQSRL